MSDGILRVNFGALQEASGQIQRALNTLNSTIEGLESEGSKLLETWSGSAQEAYWARQKQWDTASKDLANILQQIKHAVDESATDYSDTERAATNRFQ